MILQKQLVPELKVLKKGLNKQFVLIRHSVIALLSVAFIFGAMGRVHAVSSSNFSQGYAVSGGQTNALDFYSFSKRVLEKNPLLQKYEMRVASSSLGNQPAALGLSSAKSVLQPHSSLAMIKFNRLQEQLTAHLLGNLLRYLDLRNQVNLSKELMQTYQILIDQLSGKSKHSDEHGDKLAYLRFNLSSVISSHAQLKSQMIAERSALFLQTGEEIDIDVQAPKYLPSSIPSNTNVNVILKSHPEVIYLQSQEKVNTEASEELSVLRSKLTAKISEIKQNYSNVSNAWMAWNQQVKAFNLGLIADAEKRWQAEQLSFKEYIDQLALHFKVRADGLQLHGQVWKVWAQWLTATGTSYQWLESLSKLAQRLE